MKVGFYATLRPIVGGKFVEVDLTPEHTVQDLLDHLFGRFPDLREAMLDEDGALSRRVHVFLDGRGVVYLEGGLATPLGSAERIDIFPAVAGGR